MLEILLKGIFIGLCISVPLGPIGMLCVQRTFNRGFKHGFATGLGATSSDLFYAFISLFFLSIVIGFINQNLLFFQLLGSAIIIIFGFFIYKSNPSMQPKPNDRKNYNLLSDYITAFALTFSNPLILFILIALFTYFDFINESTTNLQKTIGILSIALGAMFWWATLSFLVNKFRHKVSMRGLKIINQITGIIIITIGIVGFFLTIIER